MLGDDAVVTKSLVSGEWLMIDYKINTPANKEINDSYEVLSCQ